MTVNCLASRSARPAFDPRSTDPPDTRTTGGPEPSRSKAIVVPSLDVTFSISNSSWCRRGAPSHLMVGADVDRSTSDSANATRAQGIHLLFDAALPRLVRLGTFD